MAEISPENYKTSLHQNETRNNWRCAPSRAFRRTGNGSTDHVRDELGRRVEEMKTLRRAARFSPGDGARYSALVDS